MIAIYVKLIFVAAMLLVRPAPGEYEPAHGGNGAVAIAFNPAPKFPAQRSSKSATRRNVLSRKESRPAANATGVSATALAKITDAHSTVGTGLERTTQEQVMAATTVAERVSAASAVQARDQKASPSHTNRLVAILMARPEIKSISDLAGKTIAMDNRQSASSNNARTAIVAAGAVEVQLLGGQTKAIERLISGEVPAAVLTLVSPEAAEGFPDIKGFKVFRVPLSPG